MELALICAQQVIVLFLLIGVGTLAVKTGVLKLEHKQPLSNLLVNIVVPAMIVNSYQMKFSLEILRNLLAAACIWIYVAAAGFPPSAVRAAVMAGSMAGISAMPCSRPWKYRPVPPTSRGTWPRASTAFAAATAWSAQRPALIFCSVGKKPYR